MTARKDLTVDFDEENNEKDKADALEFATNALSMTEDEYKNYVREYCQGDKEKIKNFNELLLNRYKYYKYHNRLDEFSWSVKMRYEGFLKQSEASKSEPSKSEASKSEPSKSEGKGIQKRKTKGKTNRRKLRKTKKTKKQKNKKSKRQNKK
jgi:hypothetical protein